MSKCSRTLGLLGIGVHMMAPMALIYTSRNPIPLWLQGYVTLDQLWQRYLAPLDSLPTAYICGITGSTAPPLTLSATTNAAGVRAGLSTALYTFPPCNLSQHHLCQQL